MPAARALQWGHRLSAMETVKANSGIGGEFVLQWGHRLSAMETARVQDGPAVLVVPSMGPPPFGDGNTTRQSPTTNTHPTFNGATAFRRWKPGPDYEAAGKGLIPSMGPPPFGDGNLLPPGHPGAADLRPSMGPPPFGDGNLLKSSRASITFVFLQWGHRLSAMETFGAPNPLLPGGPTFNGATAFRRWKRTLLPAAWQTLRDLQWGHRLSAMET